MTNQRLPRFVARKRNFNFTHFLGTSFLGTRSYHTIVLVRTYARTRYQAYIHEVRASVIKVVVISRFFFSIFISEIDSNFVNFYFPDILPSVNFHTRVFGRYPKKSGKFEKEELSDNNTPE